MAWSSIEQNWKQFSRNVKQKWVKLSTRLVEFLCLSQANRLELGKERKSARSGAEVLPSAALCLVHAHSCCKYLRPPAERCNGTLSIVRIDPACLTRATNASRYSSGVVEDIL